MLLPTNLYAQEIVWELQLSCEHSRRHIDIGKSFFPRHISTSKEFEDSMKTSISFQAYSDTVFIFSNPRTKSITFKISHPDDSMPIFYIYKR